MMGDTASNDKYQGRSRRMRERMSLALPVRVRCRETQAHEWTEITKLIDVTPFGARFLLTHPTETGRLLHLILPLPRQLRCFDHAEDQYQVWSLVRAVRSVEDVKQSTSAQRPKNFSSGASNVAHSPIGQSLTSSTSTANEASRFDVGVAFIGKQPPASFLDDPTTRYEVLAQGASGLWQLKEITKLDRPRYVSPDQPRPETRFNLPIEVTIEARDASGKIVAREETVTENISRRGAAVFTSLQLERGRFVRLTSRAQNISVTAVVRACKVGANGIMRLHLEFIDKQFPLDVAE